MRLNDRIGKKWLGGISLKAKLSVMLLSCILLFSIFQNTSSAYELKGWRFTSTSFISFKWGSTLQDGVLKTGWLNAASVWRTSTNDNVRFYHDTQSVNYLTRFTDADTTYFGKMLTTAPNNRVTKFEGFLNDNAVFVSSVAQSTSVHELGHALGLGHSTSTAVMNSNRDRTRITTPQKDDLDGIKAIYGF